MTNYSLPEWVQGSTHTPMTAVWTGQDLTGATLTGGVKRVATGVEVAIAGTLTPDADQTTNKGKFTWAMDAADVGTAGAMRVQLTATYAGTGKPDSTIEMDWYIHPLMGADEVAAAGFTTVTTPERAWLTLAEAGGTLGTAAYAASGDFDAAGSAAAVVGDLSDHVTLTTTAHGGILPADAGIVSVSAGRDLAASDAGKILECDGTFTLTAPNGLDAGFQCAIVNVGSGTITLAATTTLQTKDGAVTLPNQYGAATIYHRGSNVWLAFGDLA